MNKILKPLAVFTFVVAFVIFILSFVSISLAGDVYVKGYYRNNGTYVQPHYRSSPNNTMRDNWSYKGNVTPYTSKEGYKSYPSLTFPSYDSYNKYVW